MDDLRMLSILMGGAQWAVRFAHDNPDEFRAYIARNTEIDADQLPSALTFQRNLDVILAMLQNVTEEAVQDFERSIITAPPEITNI